MRAARVACGGRPGLMFAGRCRPGLGGFSVDMAPNMAHRQDHGKHLIDNGTRASL